jgi:hypothetical protein
MQATTTTLSHTIRKKFAKDMSLPISVIQDPYWEHQIEYLDPYYNIKSKLEVLKRNLAEYKDEGSFLSKISGTREYIIDHIKGKEAYKTFSNCKMPNVKAIKRTQKHIYNPQNAVPEGVEVKDVSTSEFKMISIDLVKANFQSFKCFHPALVDHCDTYADFASQFKVDDYFLLSKQIRQIIFGNLNPKRQQAYQKVIMSNIADHIEQTFAPYGQKLEVLTTTSDEIVLSTDHSIQQVDRALAHLPYEIRTEEFVITRLPNAQSKQASSVYVKTYPDGTFELKCCPGHYVMEVLRHLNGEEPNEMDRVFYQDGRLCSYKDPLFA